MGAGESALLMRERREAERAGRLQAQPFFDDLVPEVKSRRVSVHYRFNCNDLMTRRLGTPTSEGTSVSAGINGSKCCI
jgi:hypothetical protein